MPAPAAAARCPTASRPRSASCRSCASASGCSVMTVLKWILIVVVVIYLVGVAVLYFKQREMLFPIPPVGRTPPAEAGLPEAEEHVLTTADGEKVIVWHVPA